MGQEGFLTFSALIGGLNAIHWKVDILLLVCMCVEGVYTHKHVLVRVQRLEEDIRGPAQPLFTLFPPDRVSHGALS